MIMRMNDWDGVENKVIGKRDYNVRSIIFMDIKIIKIEVVWRGDSEFGINIFEEWMGRLGIGRWL